MLEVPDSGFAPWSWILYGHWTLVHPCTEFWIYLDFEDAENIHVLSVLILGCEDTGDSWLGFGILILIRIWSLIFSTPMFWILATSWFWRCKDHPYPSSPDLGLWMMIEVPDSSFASWYWFGYGHWSLIHPWLEFWFSILILKVERT